MEQPDWIDELVDAQLANRGAVRGYVGRCPHECGSEWHGMAHAHCPGSTRELPSTPSVSDTILVWPVT